MGWFILVCVAVIMIAVANIGMNLIEGRDPEIDLHIRRLNKSNKITRGGTGA